MLFNYLMLTVDCCKAELLLRDYALQMHIAKANSDNSGATYLYRKEKETYEWIFSWLSRYCSRARSAMELPNMQAIIQLTGCQRHASLIYSILL